MVFTKFRNEMHPTKTLTFDANTHTKSSFHSLYSWPLFKLPVGFYFWERRDDLHEWMTYLKICMFTCTHQGNVNRMQNTEVEPWRKCQTLPWFSNVYMGPAVFDQWLTWICILPTDNKCQIVCTCKPLCSCFRSHSQSPTGPCRHRIK